MDSIEVGRRLSPQFIDNSLACVLRQAIHVSFPQ